MPGFRIYELDKAMSAIRFFPQDADSAMTITNKEFEKQMQDNIQGRTLLLAFVRMSSKRKIGLLTNMFQLVRNLRILADILNIFFSVNTKLIYYSKISTDSNSAYDQFVQDHDRMMDLDALEESVLDNTEWFTNLEDTDQMNMITSLMRLSGGSIIKKMYVRLIKIFNKRNAEGKQDYKEYKSTSSMIFPDNCEEELIKIPDFQQGCVYEDEESDYNPDCSAHKKVLEARKQWQGSMAKLRKEIESEVQKLNEPILQRNKERQRSQFNKDDVVTKNTARTKIKDAYIDWVQFLPVWNVKKIFSYLDEKTLHNLKNVNDYWATISKEVLAENKAREYLDATIKKSEEFLDNLLDSSLPKTKLEIEREVLVTEASGYRKRREKQRRTATSFRRKEKDSENHHNKSVLSECFKEFDPQNATFLTKLKPFPTSIPYSLEFDADQSVNASLSEVASFRVTQTKFPSETKSSNGSRVEKVSSATSIMSLVPSIVVSLENMTTW